MLDWMTLTLLLCSLFSLALFIFIIRFAVRTEMVITTSVFTLLVTIGLFSWAMQTALTEEADILLWSNIAFLCGILMFPLLIYLFIERAGSTSFIVTTAKGRVVLFSPIAVHILTHYLLPDGFSKSLDIAFVIFWLAVTFHVWRMLYTRMQETSSEIRKNQIEFMLSSFFVVMLYNLMLIFHILFPLDTLKFSLIYCIAIVGAQVMTINGLVKYQMVIGTELLMRNSMILLLTSIICVSLFVVAHLTIMSLMEPFIPNYEVALSTVLVVVIVLSINPINNIATLVVERVSPQLKWQESNVKEIFVLHSNGLVIAHAGHDMEEGEIDRDMVGGMLTAIQNFVQEAFLDSEMETLKSLSMGKLRMLIEAKSEIVVAVLFTGYEARELRKDVNKLVHELEQNYGDILRNWKGDKSSVADVQAWTENMLDSMRKDRS